MLVLLAATAALLPAILSSDMAKGPLLGIVENRLGVPVKARDLSFSWGGPQRVEGLEVGEPQGFPQDESLFQAKSLSVDTGLLGLLSSEKPIVAQAEEPAAIARRDAGGRFNFEALARQKPPPEKPPPDESPPRPPGEKKKPPRIERKISLSVKDGRLDYHDAVNGTSARLQAITVAMDVDPDQARLQAGAELTRPDKTTEKPGPKEGKIELQATAGGLASLESLAGAKIDAQGEASSVDLTPYRALIENLWGLAPPSKPLNGKFRASTAEGKLTLTAALDAGAAKLDETTLSVPLSAGGPPASLQAPFALDVGGALAVVDPKGERSKGAKASGRVEGRLEVSAPVSLDDLVQKGVRSLEDVTLNLALSARDVELSPPGPNAKSITAGKGSQPFEMKLAVQGGLSGMPALANIDATGTLTGSGPAAFGDIVANKLTASLRLSEGTITLKDGDLALNNGRVLAPEIAMNLLAHPLSYRLKAEAKDVETSYDFSPVLAYVLPFLAAGERKAEIGGKIEASLTLEGMGFQRFDLERSLAGQGKVRIRDGKVGASKFFQDLAKLLGGEIDTVAFSETGSDFQIGDAKIECQKVFFTGGEGAKVRNLGLRGTTWLDGRLDYGVDLAMLQETIGDRKIQKILEGAQKLLGQSVLPLRLQGTLKDPRLALDPKALVPAAAKLPDLKGIPGLEKLPDLGDILPKSR